LIEEFHGLNGIMQIGIRRVLTAAIIVAFSVPMSAYSGNPNILSPAPMVQVPPNYAGWTRSSHPIRPIGDPGQGANLLAENMVYDPASGLYWLSFSNYRDITIGLASSTDPGNPESWHWNGQNPVVHNAMAPHLVQSGGTWYLFYGDHSTDPPYSIRVSTATNVQGPYSSPGKVVLSPSDDWESYRVDEPFVFQRNDGKWILIYMGDSGDDTEQIGFATADNVAGPYTKSPGNPVLRFDSHDYDNGTIADPWVYSFTNTTASPPTTTYYIGYSASDRSSSPWQTAYATTTDWNTFTKQGIMLPLNTSGWDSSNSFRGAVSVVGNNYVLIYTGQHYELGVATEPAFVPRTSLAQFRGGLPGIYERIHHTAYRYILMSVLGILSDVVLVCGLIAGRRLDGWTALLLGIGVASSMSGLLFSFRFQRSEIIELTCLTMLALSVLVRYERHSMSGWPRVCLIAGEITLYLNMVLLVVQCFRYIPILRAMAPRRADTPFLATEIIVLGIFCAFLVRRDASCLSLFGQETMESDRGD
jgi:hypothetical protein